MLTWQNLAVSQQHHIAIHVKWSRTAYLRKEEALDVETALSAKRKLQRPIPDAILFKY